MSLIEPDAGRTIGPEPAAPPEVLPELKLPEEKPEAAPEEETFDRKYVESLRDEAARYRTRSRDYETTFGEMPEDIRSGWLELINLANSGDPQATQMLGQMLGFVPEQEETFTEPDQQFLTREDVAEIARQEAMQTWQQGESNREQQEAVKGVESQAKSLGYEKDSPEYVELLWFANNMDTEALAPGQNLLEAADAQVKEYRRTQYEQFVARKEEEARTSPQTPMGNGVAPAMPQVPKTWEAARDSLHERLSNQQ